MRLGKASSSSKPHLQIAGFKFKAFFNTFAHLPDSFLMHIHTLCANIPVRHGNVYSPKREPITTRCRCNRITQRRKKTARCLCLTFVESSSNLVCSAINRTQKQLLCISGGQLECENAGLFITGLLMPPEPLSPSGSCGNSSDSECGIGMGPWIWQLPPNGPVLLKLHRNGSNTVAAASTATHM